MRQRRCSMTSHEGGFHPTWWSNTALRQCGSVLMFLLRNTFLQLWYLRSKIGHWMLLLQEILPHCHMKYELPSFVKEEKIHVSRSIDIHWGLGHLNHWWSILYWLCQAFALIKDLEPSVPREWPTPGVLASWSWPKTSTKWLFRYRDLLQHLSVNIFCVCMAFRPMIWW